MRGQGRGIAAAAVTAVLVALVPLAGCGDEDKAPAVHVSDAKIVKALDLEKAGKNFTIAGNTNCQVSTELLNDQGEVAKARADASTKPFVVEASKGDYGVVGVPIFTPSCGKKAVAGLDKVKLPKK